MLDMMKVPLGFIAAVSQFSLVLAESCQMPDATSLLRLMRQKGQEGET